ncbi:cell division protein FtsA [Jeotgalibaca ciconiae]|uniref:Cell division protein FtsA n=1 Tax=Jeotgalibaca ciconiae TaxID=2496265 RepID=A0A3Q9BLG2_9LACT|nr:cell division protein FtsA [Jeotgalibaca ciconiae]AZP05094.1 cell division protein FtsA [Jeotgalibaca ciconiae]HJB23219.1 cell division protein FtsA [Candidatus Jeotgalibaca pullicola]
MKNQGLFVSLDIGTTSIKVVVAEYVNNQLNIIGVGNEMSKGLSRGVIVDIDETVDSIKRAVEQAERKANIPIRDVIVGIPGNQISIEPCHGMYGVASENKEITDKDVQNVFNAARVRSLPPEREIISVIPEEFIVDGFDGIRDPRGMIGVRLELYASMITGPKTIVHNIKRCVERAGLAIQDMVVQPLGISSIAMNKGERDFGTILIDMGGGQTTASVMHDDQLKFVYVDQEGGSLITKDISIILNTTIENAEKIKREYGYAIPSDTSDQEYFPVEVIGKDEPVRVDEKYLSEIIEARVLQILENVKRALDQVEAFELPGGIILTGGGAALPGVLELAEEVFESNVKMYIPEQMGMRNPIFSTSLGLIKFVGEQDDIYQVAKNKAKKSSPIQTQTQKQNVVPLQQKQEKQEYSEPVTEEYTDTEPTKKDSVVNQIKQFIQSIFE